MDNLNENEILKEKIKKLKKTIKLLKKSRSKLKGKLEEELYISNSLVDNLIFELRQERENYDNLKKFVYYEGNGKICCAKNLENIKIEGEINAQFKIRK